MIKNAPTKTLPPKSQDFLTTTKNTNQVFLTTQKSQDMFNRCFFPSDNSISLSDLLGFTKGTYGSTKSQDRPFSSARPFWEHICIISRSHILRYPDFFNGNGFWAWWESPIYRPYIVGVYGWEFLENTIYPFTKYRFSHPSREVVLSSSLEAYESGSLIKSPYISN